jgi:Protein of unknown function (DUF2591)
MKVKTIEASSMALNWAVAKFLGYEIDTVIRNKPLFVKVTPASSFEQFNPTADWKSFHLFEKSQIELIRTEDGKNWRAIMNRYNQPKPIVSVVGPTQLIAAVKCFVFDKYGETINIPASLK